MKIIFLDVDGVLNGYGLGTEIAIRICELDKSGTLRKFYRKHYDIFGVHESKVKRLHRIVKSTEAKIVLSSTWRHDWPECYCDGTKLLKKLLHKYNIEVIDKTPDLSSGQRGEEILYWLSKHEDDIESFVIIDDERFDIETLFSDRLVQTSYKPYIRGHWTERTGLKHKHISQAIHILNTPLKSIS